MSEYSEILKKAESFENSGQFEEAISVYNDYVEKASDKSIVYYKQALLNYKLNQLDDAIASLEKAVELGINDTSAFNNLGVFYYSKKIFKEARSNFQKAIDIDPNYTDAIYNLANVSIQQGRNEEARIALIRCLDINADFGKAKKLLKKVKLEGIKNKEYLRIRIVAFSDIERDEDRKLRWGDYWFKEGLKKEFKTLGHEITNKDPDIILHLFGAPLQGIPLETYNIIWIHSHPDWIKPEILRNYDEIFCLSPIFRNKLNSLGFDVKLLVGASSKKYIKSSIKYDIVFVGNAKGGAGRKIIRDLGNLNEFPYKLKIWGEGWNDIIPKKFFGGLYYDNQRLSELYASSLISLNDHHDDMIENGFMNPRIFDILASGGFVISERNPVIEEIFEDTVPQYESSFQLRKLLDYYIQNPQERLKLMKKGREIASNYTYRECAKNILKSLGSFNRGIKMKDEKKSIEENNKTTGGENIDEAEMEKGKVLRKSKRKEGVKDLKNNKNNVTIICGAIYSGTSMIAKLCSDNGAWLGETQDSSGIKKDYKIYENARFLQLCKNALGMDKDLKGQNLNKLFIDFFNSLPKDRTIILKFPEAFYLLQHFKSNLKLDFKVVYVLRNPYTRAMSYHNRTKMPNFVAALQDWNEAYLRISQTTKDLDVYTVLYERFFIEPEFETKRLFDFIGLECDRMDISSIDKTKKRF